MSAIGRSDNPAIIERRRRWQAVAEGASKVSVRQCRGDNALGQMKLLPNAQGFCLTTPPSGSCSGGSRISGGCIGSGRAALAVAVGATSKDGAAPEQSFHRLVPRRHL